MAPSILLPSGLIRTPKSKCDGPLRTAGKFDERHAARLLEDRICEDICLARRAHLLGTRRFVVLLSPRRAPLRLRGARVGLAPDPRGRELIGRAAGEGDCVLHRTSPLGIDRGRAIRRRGRSYGTLPLRDVPLADPAVRILPRHRPRGACARRLLRLALTPIPAGSIPEPVGRLAG